MRHGVILARARVIRKDICYISLKRIYPNPSGIRGYVRSSEVVSVNDFQQEPLPQLFMHNDRVIPNTESPERQGEVWLLRGWKSLKFGAKSPRV